MIDTSHQQTPRVHKRNHPPACKAPLENWSSKIKMQMFISAPLSGLSAGESSFRNSESVASLEKSQHCFVSKSLCHTATVEVLTRKQPLLKSMGGTHCDGDSFPGFHQQHSQNDGHLCPAGTSYTHLSRLMHD